MKEVVAKHQLAWGFPFLSPCLSLDGEREKTGPTALLGLKTQIRHSLDPAGMPFSRCSRGQRSEVKGHGIRKTFGDRPSSKKADGEGQFLRPRLHLWTSCCVAVWSVECCLSTGSPSQRAVAEEDKGPCREKPGTEELGKSRKSQGEMRGSDRDGNGSKGGRQGEADAQPNAQIAELNVQPAYFPHQEFKAQRRSTTCPGTHRRSRSRV